MTTQEETEALEPCPFCGDALVQITEPVGDDMHQTQTFWAHSNHRQSDCWLSDATIPHDPAEIAAWNHRPAARGMRKALEKAAAQFEYYAREHHAKASAAMTTGPTFASLKKAETNEGFAKMCRDALAASSAEASAGVGALEVTLQTVRRLINQEPLTIEAVDSITALISAALSPNRPLAGEEK